MAEYKPSNKNDLKRTMNIKTALSEFTIRTNGAFSRTECPGLRNLVYVLDPKVVLPSRRTHTRDVD